jgi:hypothetical protein
MEHQGTHERHSSDDWVSKVIVAFECLLVPRWRDGISTVGKYIEGTWSSPESAIKQHLYESASPRIFDHTWTIKMPALPQFDYIFAIATLFAFLDAWNIGMYQLFHATSLHIASELS